MKVSKVPPFLLTSTTRKCGYIYRNTSFAAIGDQICKEEHDRFNCSGIVWELVIYFRGAVGIVVRVLNSLFG